MYRSNNDRDAVLGQARVGSRNYALRSWGSADSAPTERGTLIGGMCRSVAMYGIGSMQRWVCGGDVLFAKLI